MMDQDLALALSLQQFENDDDIQEIGMLTGVKLLPKDQIGLKENLGHGLTTSNALAGRPLSIVDETWELIDPVPNIHELFIQFNQAYFEGKLAGVEVRWSPRMTLCAGLCCYEGRGGLCSIRLSEPLLKLRPRKDLVQTLLHEMIHALLFVTHNNKDHDSHGPEFHKHMYRINKQTGSNITVYHNFHDEVKNYRQHWWKCDGPCQKRAPFFGIVRRAMNRAPSKNDTWWAEHLRTCGGQFKKIKEPEDYGKKGNKRKISEKNTKNSKVDAERNSSDPVVNKSPSLSKWFKPIKELDAPNPDNIRERKNDNLDSLKKPLSMFSGNGHRLDSGQSVRSVSKEQWIENLMKKQVGVSGKRQIASGFLSAAGSQQKPPKAIEDGAANQKTRVNIVSSSTVSRPCLTHKDTDVECEDACMPADSGPVSLESIPKTVQSMKTSGPSIGHSESRPKQFWIRKDVEQRGIQTIPIVINDSSPCNQRNTKFVECPACPKSIPENMINAHLDKCLAQNIS